MVKLFLKNSNLCDHNSPTSQKDGQTDVQTDRQTTCDRNTALCTKVHRAVIKSNVVVPTVTMAYLVYISITVTYVKDKWITANREADRLIDLALAFGPRCPGFIPYPSHARDRRRSRPIYSLAMPLFYLVATLDKLFTHIASPVFSAPRIWHTNGSIRIGQIERLYWLSALH